jgi:hypothetical protein
LGKGKREHNVRTKGNGLQSHVLPEPEMMNSHGMSTMFDFISFFLSLDFVGLAYYQGKDIVFKFIIEYSSLRDFGP